MLAIKNFVEGVLFFFCFPLDCPVEPARSTHKSVATDFVLAKFCIGSYYALKYSNGSYLANFYSSGFK